MGSGYERPGRGVYVTASRALVHGDIAVQNGIVGTCIKQAQYSADSARGPGRQSIAIGERFFLRTKGIAEAATGAGQQGNGVAAAAVGATIYVADGTGADAHGLLFSATAAGRQKLGRVHAVPGVHGTPTGILRIDMDLKDSF
jgi:hypothetical protein